MDLHLYKITTLEFNYSLMHHREPGHASVWSRSILRTTTDFLNLRLLNMMQETGLLQPVASRRVYYERS